MQRSWREEVPFSSRAKAGRRTAGPCCPCHWLSREKHQRFIVSGIVARRPSPFTFPYSIFWHAHPKKPPRTDKNPRCPSPLGTRDPRLADPLCGPPRHPRRWPHRGQRRVQLAGSARGGSQPGSHGVRRQPGSAGVNSPPVLAPKHLVPKSLTASLAHSVSSSRSCSSPFMLGSSR